MPSRATVGWNRTPGVVPVVGAALLIGVVWISIEFNFAAFTDLGFDRAESALRFARFLPWHLGLFGLLGLGIAVGTARFRPAVDTTIWLLLGAATFVFLVLPLSWGLLRTSGGHVTALTLSGVGSALTASFALLGLLGRRLPDRLRVAWSTAIGAGWLLLFIPYMRRAASSFVLTKPRASQIGEFLLIEEVSLAIGVALLLLCVGVLFPRRRGIVPATLLAGLLTTSVVGWSRAHEMPRPRSGFSSSGLPDIVVLLFDTLRADHVGKEQAGNSLTPALDSLAAQSVRFERSYSPGNRTRTAMPALMTSLSVRITGTDLSPEAVTFAEHLQQAGYTTVGLSANPIVSAQFGYEQGFDELVDPAGSPDFLIASVLKITGAVVPGFAYRLGLLDADLYYRSIRELRRRGMRLLDGTHSPTLLYIHTMEMHGPYLPPRRFLPDDYEPRDFLSYFSSLRMRGRGFMSTPDLQPPLENLRQRYSGELRFSDQELGLLIDDLKLRGRWDETLVWVVSDHGECFGEHDWTGHGGGLWTTLTHVPLLLKPPKSLGIAPRVVQTVVSTRDVLPTTLSLLGLPVPDKLLGRDLSRLIRGEGRDHDRIVISTHPDEPMRTYSAIGGPWKLEVSLDENDLVLGRELFRLDREGGESEDVSEEFPEVVAELSRALEKRREEEVSWDLEARERQLDPLTEERLRSLGYVD